MLHFTIATPAFPDNGAHGVQGPSLRRRRAALRERHAPPSADADDRRQPGSRAAGAARRKAPRVGTPGRRVGLVEHRATGASASAIGARFAALRKAGVAIAIADAIDNDDLLRLGAAVRELPLVCAGSGLAIGLPRQLRHRRRRARRRRCRAVRGLLRDRLGQLLGGDQRAGGATSYATVARRGASIRSRSAPARMRRRSSPSSRAGPSASGPSDAARPVLVYSTAAPEAVAAAQARWARAKSARGSKRCSPTSRGRWSSAARAGSSSPAARPRVRASRHLAIRALRIGAADRSRRSLVPRRARARVRRLAPGAEVGQLRQRRFLQPRVRGPDMNEARLREELCRVGRSLHARGYVHGTTGNLSARLHDGFLISATDACLGDLDPAALVQVDARGGRRARDGRARRSRCTAASTPRRPKPAASSTPIRAHLVGAEPRDRRRGLRRLAAADHAVLRDEGRTRAAARLRASRRSGGRRSRRRGDR